MFPEILISGAWGLTLELWSRGNVFRIKRTKKDKVNSISDVKHILVLIIDQAEVLTINQLCFQSFKMEI